MHYKFALLTLLAASSAPSLAAPVKADHGLELPPSISIGPEHSPFFDEKRGLSESDIALGSLGTELGKGLAVGGGLAGLGALADHFLGKDASQDQSQKREWTDLHARQLGKLLGTAAEDTVGDALKKGLVNGAGAAVGGSVVGGLIHEFTGNDNQKRHHHKDTTQNPVPISHGPVIPGPLGPGPVIFPSEKRQLGKLLGTATEDTVGDALKRGLVNGAGAAVGGSVVGGLIHEFSGSSDNDKRDNTKEQFAEAIEAIKAKLDIESTANPQKRQLGKLLGTAAEDTVGDVLKKGLVNGAGAAVGGSVVGGLIHEFTGNNNDKREPIELGTVGKGLLGTAAGLGASAVIGDGIDKIEGLFGANSNPNSKRQFGIVQVGWRRTDASTTVDNSKRGFGEVGGAIGGGSTSPLVGDAIRRLRGGN